MTTKIIVTGDTFQVKNFLKEMNFKWNPDKKRWKNNADKIDKGQLLYHTTTASEKRRNMFKLVEFKTIEE